MLIIMMALFSSNNEITMLINDIATAKSKILWLNLLLITFFKIKTVGQKYTLPNKELAIKLEMTTPVSPPNKE